MAEADHVAATSLATNGQGTQYSSTVQAQREMQAVGYLGHFQRGNVFSVFKMVVRVPLRQPK
jgi:hypothetical protein